MESPEAKPKNDAPPDLRSQAAQVIQSSELFGSKKMVLISHNDDWYKLMITKQNKLILMK